MQPSAGRHQDRRAQLRHMGFILREEGKVACAPTVVAYRVAGLAG